MRKRPRSELKPQSAEGRAWQEGGACCPVSPAVRFAAWFRGECLPGEEGKA